MSLDIRVSYAATNWVWANFLSSQMSVEKKVNFHSRPGREKLSSQASVNHLATVLASAGHTPRTYFRSRNARPEHGSLSPARSRAHKTRGALIRAGWQKLADISVDFVGAKVRNLSAQFIGYHY